MKRILLLLALSVSFQQTQAQSFGWENATVTDNIISETINGITATVESSEPNTVMKLLDFFGLYETSGKVVVSQTATTAIKFSFSQSVFVNSLKVANTRTAPISITLSTGSETPIQVTIPNESTTEVALGWSDITSFVVTTDAPNKFTFDDLVVNNQLLNPSFAATHINIYPNPVNDFLHIDGVENLKNISVYDPLGKLVIETSENKIDFSSLAKGTYFVKIKTEEVIVKQVIKH